MRRKDFPILNQKIAGKNLIYLDTAASAQKPQVVINAIQNYYQQNNANIHRGIHTLSERATQAFEQARKVIQKFINAQHDYEIIFTSGATESINLAACSLGRLLEAGDEIIVSTLEHHSNIVPWQMVCEQVGMQLRVIPLLEEGVLDLKAYAELFNNRTRLVALCHVSHVLGTINPIKEMIEMAHQHHAAVLIDGAQAVSHLPVDVQDLDCDFYAFSGQKLYGPSGIGVLYGKSSWLKKMPPYKTGGGMIRRVSFAKTEYADLPAKFEAGTPHISGAIGLGAAVEFVQEVGFTEIMQHENELMSYLLEQLKQLTAAQVLKASRPQKGVVSIIIPEVHPHDIATILNNDAIAVRAGNHCAMPLMERLGASATLRISLGMYNNQQEIDQLIVSLKEGLKLFQRGGNV